MIDLIHIGDYKTGTTWWQSRLLPNHAEIYYIDDPVRHPEIVRLRHLLVDSRDLDFDADAMRESFADALSRVDVGNRRSVMCCEALSGDYPGGEHAGRTAERLRTVFGETKILMVIREQLSMLKAIYSQYVKIGGTLTLEEFVFDPLGSPGLIERLRYHKIVEAYVDLFGEQNVHVGLFEAFKEDVERFANEVLGFLGCSTGWESGMQKGVVNPSLTKRGIQVQLFFNRFLRNDLNPRKSLIPLDRLAAPFLGAEKKKELLQKTRNRLIYSMDGRADDIVLRYAINFSITERVAKLCERMQGGPRLGIPDDLACYLGTLFVDSNRLLRDRHGLPVDRYGWKT